MVSGEAFGRILDEDIHSPVNIPPYPASIKDGYAVIAEDGIGDFKVKYATVAGDDDVLNCMNTLSSGYISRISTGACVPNGANAVVQVEDTQLIEKSVQNDKELVVRIKKLAKVGF